MCACALLFYPSLPTLLKFSEELRKKDISLATTICAYVRVEFESAERNIGINGPENITKSEKDEIYLEQSCSTLYMRVSSTAWNWWQILLSKVSSAEQKIMNEPFYTLCSLTTLKIFQNEKTCRQLSVEKECLRRAITFWFWTRILKAKNPEKLLEEMWEAVKKSRCWVIHLRKRAPRAFRAFNLARST